MKAFKGFLMNAREASLFIFTALIGVLVALPAGAVGDETAFRKTVLPFLEAYCLDCHDSETRKGKLSLEGISPSLAGSGLETWRLVREQLQFGDMPPKKKRQPAPAERAAVLGWIRGELLKTQEPGTLAEEKLTQPRFGNYVDHAALFDERRSHVTPAPPRLWRLRPSIYNTTMPRLGERITGLANALNTVDGSDFKDFAADYFLDEATAAPLLGNAKKIAAGMTAPNAKDRALKLLVAETPPTPGEVAEGVRTAFRKILGRLPGPEELERFGGFHRATAATAGHVTAANTLLTAILMQPEVLYRLELGTGKPDSHGRVRLSPRELAYALSYALDNRPVDAFLKAAAEGKLARSGDVARQVRQQLNDDSLLQDRNPRVLQFFREYFNYPFAREVFKDPPEGGSYKPDWLVRDLETTVRDVLRADRAVLRTLLTTRRFYVNAQYKPVKRKGVQLQAVHTKWWPYQTAFNLAPDWRWGLELQPVEFPEGERAGVLTHPAWLAAWSGNFDNHPVQRGKWVRTHLLGGTVPDVPIGVDARVPEAEHATFRARLKEATAPAECWRCHRQMDPLGVVFERYDHYGRYQRRDAGQTVDSTGLIDRTGVPGLDGRRVSGPAQLMAVLSKSAYVEQVFVRHAFRYFMGRNETLGDSNTLQDAHAAYRRSGGSFRALTESLLSSDSFLMRQSVSNRGD